MFKTVNWIADYITKILIKRKIRHEEENVKEIKEDLESIRNSVRKKL